MAWITLTRNLITTISLTIGVEIVAHSFMLPAQAHFSLLLHPELDLSSEKVTPQHNLAILAQAEVSAKEERQLPRTQWNDFSPPNRGLPGRREGGGTRGPCPPSITALIPTSTMGRTALSQPTLLYYFPVSLENAWVEFELANEDDDTLYKTSFKLSNTEPGIVSLNLAEQENAPTLEVNQSYHWYLTIKCDPDSLDASSDVLVHGWINRVALNSSQVSQLEEAQPNEQLQFYAQEALWYEMLNTVAELRRSNPDDLTLKQTWSDLLNSVGLDRIAQQPLVSSEIVELEEEQ